MVSTRTYGTVVDASTASPAVAGEYERRVGA